MSFPSARQVLISALIHHYQGSAVGLEMLQNNQQRLRKQKRTQDEEEKKKSNFSAKIKLCQLNPQLAILAGLSADVAKGGLSGDELRLMCAQSGSE